MARTQRRSVQAVTIQEVAARAGVSMMTVSNVLNRTKKVRDETRDAVLSAVEELGYLPNSAARALASARSTCVGIVYRNAQNAFLSAMLVGTLNAAARMGAQVMVRKCDGIGLEDTIEAVSALVKSGANAILLSPPYCEWISETGFMAGLGIPVCAIAHGYPLADMDSVGIDDANAAEQMTEYLLARGHRRVGFITGPLKQAAGTRRLEGFVRALKKHGIEPEPALIQPGDFSFDSGLAAAGALLDLADRPTAIFASNDDMAAAASLVAHQRGLAIPADLAIAGFDDAPIAVKIWPPMTTVRQDVEAMAERATELVVQRHRDQDSVQPKITERLAHRIVERESA